MQCYTGLVWPVAAGYLENPEDIRVCVNDTFAEFYRDRARFERVDTSAGDSWYEAGQQWAAAQQHPVCSSCYHVVSLQAGQNAC